MIYLAGKTFKVGNVVVATDPAHFYGASFHGYGAGAWLEPTLAEADLAAPVVTADGGPWKVEGRTPQATAKPADLLLQPAAQRLIELE